MARAAHSQNQSNNDRLAWENCSAHLVVQSMFDLVTDLNDETLANRSDREEIRKLCAELLEGEFIYGSPDEQVLELVDQKMLSRAKKANLSNGADSAP